MPVDHKLLGKIIRELREERQLSQEGFASLCNLSRTHIGEIERGDTALSFATLFLIAEGLGQSAAEIVEEYEKRSR